MFTDTKAVKSTVFFIMENIMGVGACYGVLPKINDLTFGDALVALKQGKKVARSGWNGKDQYVVAQAANEVESTYIWNPHNKAHAEKIGGFIKVAAYCTLKTAQDTLAMGWTPSTGDLFANDWLILE